MAHRGQFGDTAGTVAIGPGVDIAWTLALDRSVFGHEPEGDFAAASQHVMKTTSVQQLLVLSQLDANDPLKV
jgi:hypothetical protein